MPEKTFTSFIGDHQITPAVAKRGRMCRRRVAIRSASCSWCCRHNQSLFGLRYGYLDFDTVTNKFFEGEGKTEKHREMLIRRLHNFEREYFSQMKGYGLKNGTFELELFAVV
ncbi:hypothetical protein ACI65C_000530 [Semiaphis heraclei]